MILYLSLFQTNKSTTHYAILIMIFQYFLPKRVQGVDLKAAKYKKYCKIKYEAKGCLF